MINIIIVTIQAAGYVLKFVSPFQAFNMNEFHAKPLV